jgi:ornithine cyclodeaminase
MDLPFINKEKIASLLPMNECIDVMEKMFRSIASGETNQPLRSIMWLPDKTGLLGMMPGYSASLGVMGIKVITVFHSNRESKLPSHQGVVILFDTKHGSPLMIFDAAEITAIRTAAVSALATKLLSRKNSESLAIIGSGEQAQKHLESIMLVRRIKQVSLWSLNEKNAKEFAEKNSATIKINVSKSVEHAMNNADVICTVTSSAEPLIKSEWISAGTHINAVGASVASKRELDSKAILRSKLFADCYESIFNEGGDFLIPKKEGLVNDDHVKADIAEVLTGKKPGRENDEEITVFKSLGIAAEDIFSASHIYEKVKSQKSKVKKWE